MNLLVVDDDRDSANALADLLRALIGGNVQVAFDGVQAVAAATGPSTFEAVITDVEMPRMDGVAAAVEMRRALGKSCPPIIAVSGRAGHLPTHSREVFDHVLGKPVNIDGLVVLLRTI